MKNVVNRRWLLTAYPEGMPTPDNWIMDTQPVADPGPGQILIKAKWLSVDPYMRGCMSPATNYTKDLLRLAASPDARVGHSDIWPAKLLARRSVTMFYVHQ
jgi:NADPH-dependent curcumin reductase CurA